jgi:hypothetical protein
MVSYRDSIVMFTEESRINVSEKPWDILLQGNGEIRHRVLSGRREDADVKKESDE